MKKLLLSALIALTISGCAPETFEETSSAATVPFTITRTARAGHYEYLIDCAPYTVLLSTNNINAQFGTGEFRIRQIFFGTPAIVGYGGTGFLQAAPNWIAGGHGNASTPSSWTAKPELALGESTTASEFHARFTVLGFQTATVDVVDELAYNVTFKCDENFVEYVEQVTNKAVRAYDVSFEYVVVATGASYCNSTGEGFPGGFDTVNGQVEYTVNGVTYEVGCPPSGTLYPTLPATQTLVLEGSDHRYTTTTTVPLAEISQTLGRDRDDHTIKLYAKRPGYERQFLDIEQITNTYKLEYLGSQLR